MESRDAKNARSLGTYDTLSRPANGWTQNNSSDSLRLTAHTIYGEAVTDPKNNNMLGQLWQQYDESGKIESVAFDFKGNLLAKEQQVIGNAILKIALDNYETYLVDWAGLPNILDTKVFETSSTFDALNRVTKITLPENVNSEQKEITPMYNRAGSLEKVSYDGTEYVENIAYNAKGQRLLVAFGNDIMTRYKYDNRTFRLLRQRSEKYVKTLEGNKIIYTPQSGTNKQDDGFNFDLIGNILKILNRVNDCGISGSALGSDALDRNFEYDPLYRVISGDGRESNTQNQNDYLYSDAPAPGSPNANNVRAYTRKYAFDKLGNIQQLKQLGSNGFTRNFTYNAGYNTLQKIETAAPLLLEDFTYDPCGNQLTVGTTRNYVWNAGNQLITYYNQVGSADPTIFAQYDYSGMNRVSKLVKTGTSANPIYERTIYIDGIFEYHLLENGTTYEKNYVHIMDDQSRIAMVRIGTSFPDDIADAVVYNLEDQIGSSTIRLNKIGGIIDKEEYYPFGDSSFRTFTKKRYRYVGKEKDLESGLYYYGARYYAAWTCRFISVDPLASDYPFYTPYNYAGNKPIGKIDIDGLQEEGAVSSKQYATPDGGNISLPSNSSVEHFNSQNTHLIEGKEIYVLGNSVKSFEYNNITYNAVFSTKTGKFKSYLGSDGSELSYSTNTLASVSNSGKYWGEHMATAGIIAISDGPEPFVADLVALAYIVSIAIGSSWAIQNLRDFVSIQTPTIPSGGFIETISSDNNVAEILINSVKVKDSEPGDIVPTPDTDEGLFTKGKNEGGTEWVNNETGDIWSKVRGKPHRGEKWKVWPKGTKGRGKTPDRRNVGGDGTIKPGNYIL